MHAIAILLAAERSRRARGRRYVKMYTAPALKFVYACQLTNSHYSNMLVPLDTDTKIKVIAIETLLTTTSLVIS
jgi:hypothetical protein